MIVGQLFNLDIMRFLLPFSLCALQVLFFLPAPAFALRREHTKESVSLALPAAVRYHTFTVNYADNTSVPVLLARGKWNGSAQPYSFKKYRFRKKRRGVYQLKMNSADYSICEDLYVFAGNNAPQKVAKGEGAGTTLELQEPVVIPVKAYLFSGSATAPVSSDTLEMDIALTNWLFRKHRLGIRVAVSDPVSNLTTAPVTPSGSPLVGNTYFCGQDRRTLLSGSYDTSMLNVYYTSAVFSESIMGYSCQCSFGLALNNVVTINSTRKSRTLAHEIGHFLDLGHIKSLTPGDGNTSNLMFQGRTTTELTLGQAFRANYSSFSGLNCILGLSRGWISFVSTSTAGGAVYLETENYPSILLSWP